MTLPTEEDYPLPQLDAVPKPVAQPQPAVQAQPQVQAQVEKPRPQPQAVQQPSVAQRVETAAAEPAKPQVQVHIQPATAQRVGKSSVADALRSGSINELMNSMCIGNNEAESVRIDPQSEAKLKAAKERIIEKVVSRHPRFNLAFETMYISGNRVSVEVPTAVMESDLKANKGEIVDIIVDTAGIDGNLELAVVLKEVEVKLKPVKLEDRLEHVAGCNPLFSKLVEALNLEAD